MVLTKWNMIFQVNFVVIFKKKYFWGENAKYKDEKKRIVTRHERPNNKDLEYIDKT